MRVALVWGGELPHILYGCLCTGSLGMVVCFEVFGGPEGTDRLAVEMVVVIVGHVETTVEGAEYPMSIIKGGRGFQMFSVTFLQKFLKTLQCILSSQSTLSHVCIYRWLHLTKILYRSKVESSIDTNVTGWIVMKNTLECPQELLEKGSENIWNPLPPFMTIATSLVTMLPSTILTLWEGEPEPVEKK